MAEFRYLRTVGPTFISSPPIEQFEQCFVFCFSACAVHFVFCFSACAVFFLLLFSLVSLSLSLSSVSLSFYLLFLFFGTIKVQSDSRWFQHQQGAVRFTLEEFLTMAIPRVVCLQQRMGTSRFRIPQSCFRQNMHQGP